MRLGLEGRTALVTGATSGIGRAVAVELATEGADVVVVGRDTTRLDKVAQDVETAGRRAWAVAADITELAGTDLVKQQVDDLGGVDVLVNNAGGTPWGGLERFDDQQWRDGLRLKPLSYVRLTRDVLPGMKPRAGAGSSTWAGWRAAPRGRTTTWAW
ncbi:MAG: SDR family NAD(P)-dependent oxidoreductase [Streptosporangiales bacterium]|nr:SDR family NAD(P)-dependent oxidoreductase [Streptosporangiales bacterium]